MIVLKQIQESGENYLETILILKNRNGDVRAVDIANELNFSKPSVSRAMSILKSGGFITISPAGMIELTDVGLEKASQVYERHVLLTEFLVTQLHVSEEVAAQDACKIEHVISQESFERIKAILKNAQ